MESIISTFHIDWKIIIAQAVNFGIVFAILYIFALKPLSKLMTERSEKINKGIEDAKVNAEMLADTTRKYEEALARAKKDADSLFQKGKKEAEEKKAAMLEEAKKQVEAMVEGGKKTLEAEKAKLVSEARREIVDLSMQATRKIIGSEKISVDDKLLEELNQI